MGPSINTIGVELPKKIDILRRYYSFGRNLSETQKISQLLREIKTVYGNAGIATVHAELIRLKLKSLVRIAKKIISTCKLSTENQKQNEVDFRRNINFLFEVSATELFSESQASDELPSTSNTSNTNQLNLTQDYDNTDFSQDSEVMDDEYNTDLHEESSDEEYKPPQKRQKISNEMLEKINFECGQNASYRVMSSFIQIGLEIAGGNSQGYCISKSQLQKQLSKFRSNEKNNILKELVSSDSKLILQFDKKSCSKLNKRHLGLKLRLVIILRSEGSIVTLGSFMISGHGAETCATKIFDVITKYNLHNRIIGIVCDTENTNTGHLTGVCVRIEEFLERDLLRIMCRHHIYDLTLKHIGIFLFGPSTAPTFDFGCTKLKTAWEHLNLNHFTPYEDEENIEIEFAVSSFRENAVQILKMQAEKHQTRDDYAELTDLALKFFGESNITTKQFMVPGAVNNSRWMAKAIYVIKCYLFRDQIDFDAEVLHSLRRFALFISSIYVKYWNWCTNVFNAPVNDLNLLKDLEQYREVDANLANIAIDQFRNHLTYLSDEMVTLSIFSNQLNNCEKEKIRSKLIHIVGPRTEHSIRYMNDEGPFSSLQLNDFVTDRSMFLFSTSNIDASFLEHNASEWEYLE